MLRLYPGVGGGVVMAFTVTMTFIGLPTTVKWDQGEVEADPEVE